MKDCQLAVALFITVMFMGTVATAQCENVCVLFHTDDESGIAFSCDCQEDSPQVQQIQAQLSGVVEESGMDPEFAMIGDSLLLYDQNYISTGRRNPKGIIVIPSWRRPAEFQTLETYSSPSPQSFAAGTNHFVAVSPTAESHLIQINDDGAVEKFALPKRPRFRKMAVSPTGRWAAINEGGKLFTGDLDRDTNVMRLLKGAPEVTSRDLLWLDDRYLIILSDDQLVIWNAEKNQLQRKPLRKTDLSRLHQINSQRFALLGSDEQGIFEWHSDESKITRLSSLGTEGRILRFLCDGKFAITMKQTGVPGGYSHQIEATSLAQDGDVPPSAGRLSGPMILGVVDCPRPR